MSTTAFDAVFLSTCAGFITLSAFVLGLSARFIGLENVPVAVDEYYYARAADLILANGLPAFATGGYYVHGPLAQYLTAASVAIFGATGFGYRLPSVIFGLLAVWLFYVYARRYFERMPACLLASILLISSWQVEFSRFARMYSVLQFMTLAYLLIFAKAFFDRDFRWTYATHAIGVLLVLTHELGLLLLPLLFVPLCSKEIRTGFRDGRSIVTYAVVTLVTLAVCTWYSTIDFLHMGVAGAFPEGHNPPPGSSFRLPVFPFWTLGESASLTLAVFLCVCVVLVGVLAGCRRMGMTIHDAECLSALLLVSTAFHLFTVSIILGSILIVRYPLFTTWARAPRVYVFVVLSVLISVLWFVIALRSSEWLDAVPLSDGDKLEAVARAFFGWPDLYTAVVKPWSRELPILGTLGLLALLHQSVSWSRRSLGSIVRHPAFIILWIVLCVAVFKSIYASTRYFFFIYPLILLAFALALRDLVGANRLLTRVSSGTKQLGAVFLVLILFAGTEDFNFQHLTRISDPDVRFRTGEFRERALTWYPRSDYASPAHFVNRVAGHHDDLKVIVIAEPAVSYYLNVPHALYYPRDSRRFFNVSRVAGTVDLWSNQRLLSTEEELRDFTRTAETVFVIRPASSDRAKIDLRSTWPGQLGENRTVFRGIDRRIEVVMLRLPAGSVEPVL